MMEINNSFARRLRRRRLYGRDDGHLFVVPLDHSVTMGPIAGPRRLGGMVELLAGAGVDAVVLHKGVLRHVDPRAFIDTRLIVHLSASTQQAPDPDAKYLVATVEEALRLGADAVSAHVNVGSADERQQVADLAAVADACDRWNLPLMAMMYPRGPEVFRPRDPDRVAHAVTLGADLGADVVKTPLPDRPDALVDIVATCSVPVVIAGGPPTDDDEAVADHVRISMACGAGGVAIGRNVFQADDPRAAARRISQLVHDRDGLPELSRDQLVLQHR